MHIKTGEIENPIIRVMLKNSAESYRLFKAHPKFGLAVKELVGQIPSEKILKENKPPHPRWLKNMTRAINKIVYLIRENVNELNGIAHGFYIRH